jgi:hypothetical protein
MAIRTRYLQLNNVMMLEYRMNDELYDQDEHNNERFYLTRLADNHYCVFSPGDYETKTENGKIVQRSPKEVEKNGTYNTMNHLAIPIDAKDSDWYTFIDNSFEYCEENELESLKAKQYERYLKPLDDEGTLIKELTVSSDMRFDEIRLYFVNGYDFTDMFGILCRIYIAMDYDKTVDKRKLPPFVDLCNFFFTKANAYKMAQWISEPVIFASAVYDKYISIKVPCLADIWMNTDNSNVGTVSIDKILSIQPNAPLHIMVSSIEEGDYEISNINSDSKNTLRGIIRDAMTNRFSDKLNTEVNCEFFRTSTLNGAIPTERLISDNLGIYIAKNPDYKCIEFCMTWKDNYGKVKPLTYDIVSLFNGPITLYDRKLIKEESVYEIDDNYTVDNSLSIKNWVILHKLKLSYIKAGSDEVIKEESYSLTQTFVKPDQESIFYYRPFLNDINAVENCGTIIIEYSTHFMNTRDLVQFYNTGSLSIDPLDVKNYYLLDTELNTEYLAPYKVYNKIIEQKHSMSKTLNPVNKIKYVKVFYDSTDIVLEGSNGTYYTTGQVVLTLSPVSKNYKFVIKNRKQDGVYDYMDLSDGYYKLYAKDNNNNDIIIEPTYSSNMNLLFGELEFNITAKNINKLMNVDPANRKMSIVMYNEDNSVSSLFDFKYEF